MIWMYHSVKNRVVRRMLLSASKKSLGMYLWLVHPVFWYAFWRPRTKAVVIDRLGDFAMYTLLVVLCSFISAWLLECIRQWAFTRVGRTLGKINLSTAQRAG